MGLVFCITGLLVLGLVSSENVTMSDTCGLELGAEGPWSSLLEEWATSAPAHSDRHGRIMALPPASGYYVTDRIDRPPPPPHHQYPPGPPHGHPSHGPPPHGSPQHGPPQHGPPPYGPPAHMPHPQSNPAHVPPPPAPADGPFPYAEWQPPPPPPSGGKIVNKPTKPHKDQFKPSPEYPLPHPSPSSPHRGPGLVDRIDEHPPRKQVSETDLYLLSAIEKLVYRVDLMEKRLRKMEESMHYLVAGTETKPDPCVANFSRVGETCYHFSSEATDWKSANLQCRKLRANLLELDSEPERRRLTAAMLGDKRIRGVDVWTGGLNPGLLWIWSHSARPVASNSTANSTATIVGEGRCLAWVHDPAINNYVYRGQDCAIRHRFICEKEEDKAKLSNEIERVARQLKDVKSRKARILWNDDSTDKDSPTQSTVTKNDNW